MICVTRGRKGCTVISDNDQIDYKTEKIKAIDETGAGDVWATVFSISRFIWAFEINESVEMANIAAAISLGGVGSKNIPSLGQIINYRL
jgi:sugar/nucleoside kinase (ribokinase family)